MKRIALGFAAVLLTISAAAAVEPAKAVDNPLGKILVDAAKGMTLYTFDKDEKNKTNCYDQCAVNWPPFMAAADAKAEGDWTIIDRTDGTKMWAYDSKPLYFFVKDTKPGDTTGDMVGGIWHVFKD
jgi:predicted lipoprotein with Yx(FWY)xxD motif